MTKREDRVLKLLIAGAGLLAFFLLKDAWLGLVVP